MIKNLILIILVLSILLVGCQKAEEPKVAPTEPTEAEPSDISIESDISNIGSLEEDLDLDELSNIEKELDEVNW